MGNGRSGVLAGGLLAAALALGVQGGLPASPCDLGSPWGAQPPPGDLRAPGTRPERKAQDLCRAVWPGEGSSPSKTAAEAPVGVRVTEQAEVFNPLPTSAASPGPWAHSLLAFLPSWPRKTFLKTESPVTHRLSGDVPREALGASHSGIVFRKCALVSGQSDRQTVQVRLLVDNTKTPSSANLSDLLLLDNITGLTIRESAGNKTSDGFQAFRKKFLEVGDSYWVSYTASMDARALGTGNSLTLPAQLTFRSWSLNSSQLKAHFTITVEEKVTVLPNHGLHAAAFFGAFVMSFLLSWAVLFWAARCWCLKGGACTRTGVQRHGSKLEPPLFSSASGVSEDLALSDQLVDILASEDPGGMLQALEAAAECAGLLRSLHGLEQEHLQASLALQREEDFAEAHRQLAVLRRNELHSVFFSQIRSAVCEGDLKPEAAKELLQDYSKVQENVEELMDFFQASKRYHLSKRFGHREYLVQNLQSTETRVQGLLSAAAAQLTHLIQKHERAGYLEEDQTELLLERAHTEVFAVQQRLDHDLKQEKKRLRQKLLTKRRRELLQKHKEQRKQQLCVAEAARAAEDAARYLQQWRGLVAEQSAALEELQERLDQAALDELRALTLALSEKAAEELRRLQSAAAAQEPLKCSVPWLFLQQILEEQGRELAARAEQLEAEDRARGQDGVRSVRQRLRDDSLEAATEEQAELRRWEHLVFTQLCSLAFSLSEEELLQMRQDVHGCFAQMDRSLALPKIRARGLLQRLQAAWREAEFLKLDQTLAAPELQHPHKARKPRSKSRSPADLYKKRLEDRIHLLEAQVPGDLAEKARGELLRERVRRLEAQEGRFAESLVALQSQKAARVTETLSTYGALLSLQDLLLEELRDTETLTKAACTQILESHGPELQELQRKLEDRLAQQEAAQQQQALESWQRWAADGPGLLSEPGEEDPAGRMSAALQQALGKSQELLEQQQQSCREEQQSGAVLEDLLEKMEADTVGALCSQELRLVCYLCKMTLVPGATLRRLLSLVLPTASQPQLLALLDAASEKHLDHAAENEGGGDPAELARRRKHRGWWQALERRLREDLSSRGFEKRLWFRERKESILKKACPPLRERTMFSAKGSWPQLSLEPVGEPAAVPVVGLETIEVFNAGEKLFIFRNPQEPEISPRVPPRRKRRNFLNAKKATRAAAVDRQEGEAHGSL
uniref:EvC ciliary complex subunit 2 n=1 Tax=Oryctolagus cuniculus TaxID=9986 RepID=G1TBK9_RABIT